jgi:hypothetical protein
MTMLGNLFKALCRHLGRGIIDANRWGPGLPEDPGRELGNLDMTKAEWLACEAPRPMLRFLLGTDYPRVQDIVAFPNCKGSDRKMRLFACACYRLIGHLLPHPLAQATVVLAEQVADGVVPVEELQQAEARIRAAIDAIEEGWRVSHGPERKALLPTHAALALALQAIWKEAPKAAYYSSSTAYLTVAEILNPGATTSDSGSFASQKAEERCQADVLRCIFGHLFHSATIDPAPLAWNNSIVPELAWGIYEDQAFDRLPILADALEEPGCTDAEILGHLRSPGPHARGCWVVDLLTGKR